MAASVTAPSRPVRRAPAAPGRRLLAGAAAMVILGSFMPWIDTAVGSVMGMRGAGLWTFYAACLGVAGALMPWLRVAAGHAAALAVVAFGLAAWQVVHLIGIVGLEGWRPGVGLVFVIGGSVCAAVAATRLWRGAEA